MTSAERRHLNRIQRLGCIIDGCEAQAEIHHPRFAAGMSQRSSHFLAIALCPMHHRLGGLGVALHAGQQTFEAMYGTEAELLAKTIERLSV